MRLSQLCFASEPELQLSLFPFTRNCTSHPFSIRFPRESPAPNLPSPIKPIPADSLNE